MGFRVSGPVPTIAQRLRASHLSQVFRERFNIKQAYMAQIFGTSQAQISAVEGVRNKGSRWLVRSIIMRIEEPIQDGLLHEIESTPWHYTEDRWEEWKAHQRQIGRTELGQPVEGGCIL